MSAARGGFQLTPWATFTAGDIERLFSSNKNDHERRFTRFVLVVAMLLMAGYSALDCVLLNLSLPAECYGRQWPAMHRVRAGAVCALGLGLLLTFAGRLWTLHAEQLLWWLALLVAGLIGWLGLIAPDPGPSHYFNGVSFVILFCAFLFRMSLLRTTAISLILGAALLVVLIFFPPVGVDFYEKATYGFFFATFIVIAIVGSRYLQVSARRVYWETAPIASRPDVFVSYSHSDMEWKNRFYAYLSPYLRGGAEGRVWADHELKPGEKWKEEILSKAQSARIAVLLVSPAFLNSDFIMDQELPILRRCPKMYWLCLETAPYHGHLDRLQAFGDPESPLEDLDEPEQKKTLRALALAVAGELGLPSAT